MLWSDLRDACDLEMAQLVGTEQQKQGPVAARAEPCQLCGGLQCRREGVDRWRLAPDQFPQWILFLSRAFSKKKTKQRDDVVELGYMSPGPHGFIKPLLDWYKLTAPLQTSVPVAHKLRHKPLQWTHTGSVVFKHTWSLHSCTLNTSEALCRYIFTMSVPNDNINSVDSEKHLQKKPSCLIPLNL